MPTVESGGKCVPIFSRLTKVNSEPDRLILLNNCTERLIRRHDLLVLRIILQSGHNEIVMFIVTVRKFIM